MDIFRDSAGELARYHNVVREGVIKELLCELIDEEEVDRLCDGDEKVVEKLMRLKVELRIVQYENFPHLESFELMRDGVNIAQRHIDYKEA